MEEFAFWQTEKPSNDPATGLEESDSVVFVIHQSTDGSLGLFMLVDAPLDGTGGEVEIELGLGIPPWAHRTSRWIFGMLETSMI